MFNLAQHLRSLADRVTGRSPNGAAPGKGALAQADGAPAESPAAGAAEGGRPAVWEAAGRRAAVLPDPRFAPGALDRYLSIPLALETAEERERAAYQDRGQFLARQERWSDLAQLVREADRARAATEGGMAVAELLLTGARADVTGQYENLIDRPGSRPSRAGLRQLDRLAEEHRGDYAIALVVALAHIDVGWAWRGTGWTEELPADRAEAFRTHFQRAETLLEAFDPFELDSPALAGARCALLPACTVPAERVADDYEDLIDLWPGNPRYLRALGYHLLPRWFGDYDTLEHEARRTAARTRDVWGAGGYVWCYFDALAVDEGALARLDAALFEQGLRDILARQHSQHLANLMAAFCGLTLSPSRAPQAMDPRIAENRAALHANFAWILEDHLREIHPLVWAEAAHRFRPMGALPDRQRLARTGRDNALALIARQFAEPIAQGQRVEISPEGISLAPAA